MNWSNVQISKLCQINPRNNEQSNYVDDYQVSFVPMQAVSEVSCEIEELIVRRIKDVKKGFTFFKEDDILFAKITPCMENGKIAIAKNLKNGIGYGSTEFHVLRVSNLLVNKYLYYYLRQESFRKEAKLRMSGAVGQQRVPLNFLQNHQLPLPPRSEQYRIIEILDQADEIRKLRKQADEKAEKIVPTLFTEMFGDPLTYSGIMTIREIVKKVEQKDFKKYPDIEFNYIDISSVDGKTGKIISYSKYFGSDAPSRAKQIIKHNDVIISTVRPYLKATALVPKDLDNQVCSTGFCVIRTKADYGFGFLYALSRLNWFSEKLMTLARGASYPAVSDSDILNMSIPYPTQKESLIKKFDDIIINLELKRDLREQANKKIQNLFDLLLSKAFDGSLTASWRAAHMKEILQEMEEQKKFLEKFS
ncbi:MAG: hsdS2a [Ignavibacteria bacterium]|nr:MAG: hsdS2a [Ignavibacteria bacterium]KAF0158924.1 MAG: hsdS2a [Ignavibacteria bacterium]